MKVSAVAVQPGDLLGAVLEEHAAVGRLHHFVVSNVDLVLARRRLALAELDRDSGFRHLVADLAVQRLELGRLEEVVVLVVVADPLDILVALLGEILEGVREDVELELRTRLDGVAQACGPLGLALEHRPGRDRDLRARLLVDRVAQDDRGRLEPGQNSGRLPRLAPDPVAVPGLPVHQLEAVRRVHLHVRAEQVRAEVNAVVDHALEEGLGLDPFAHEAALHVGQGDDDRVDPAIADHPAQLLEPLGTLVAGATAGDSVLVAHLLLPFLAGRKRRLPPHQKRGDFDSGNALREYLPPVFSIVAGAGAEGQPIGSRACLSPLNGASRRADRPSESRTVADFGSSRHPARSPGRPRPASSRAAAGDHNTAEVGEPR